MQSNLFELMLGDPTRGFSGRTSPESASAGGAEPYYANAEGSEGLPCLTASNVGKHVNNQTPLLVEPTAYAIAPESGQGAELAVRQVDVAPALTATEAAKTDRGTRIVEHGRRVRRLTPRECERLQGFTDDHTLVPGVSESARYRALGNSMAVPVIRWIGERLRREAA